MRIAYYGPPAVEGTGFGNVATALLDGFRAAGHEVQTLSALKWIAPFDILFLFGDSFAIAPVLKGLRVKEDPPYKTIAYFPVDGTPRKAWIEAMALADVPVTYTEFGRRECSKACPAIEEKLQVIPHGLDLEVFYPEPADRSIWGKHSKKFVVANINRNQQRKDIPRTLMAFKRLEVWVPDSVLYLHMESGAPGWDIPSLCEAVGLKLGENVLLPERVGVSRAEMRRLYNSVDVVMSTTLGEGWGLSSTEAMACGTPVVFPDNSALSEIIGRERGYLVESGEEEDDWTVLTTDPGVLRPVTSVGDMASTLIRVARVGDERRDKAEAARAWVQGLSWSKVMPRWMEIIEGLEAA